MVAIPPALISGGPSVGPLGRISPAVFSEAAMPRLSDEEGEDAILRDPQALAFVIGAVSAIVIADGRDKA